MAFYSSTIFSTAGYNVTQSLLASWGFGLVTLIFALPAVYTMDVFGRRNLLLFTFPNMAWCLLAAGFCFLIPDASSARVPLIAFFIYLFSALYGPGIGPIPSIYFSEAFPLSHREIGAAVTICVNNAMGSALGLTFPSLLAKIGPTGGGSVLEEDLHRQRLIADVYLYSFRLLRRPEHHRFYRHLLHRSRNEATVARGAGLRLWRADNPTRFVSASYLAAVVD